MAALSATMALPQIQRAATTTAAAAWSSGAGLRGWWGALRESLRAVPQALAAWPAADGPLLPQRAPLAAFDGLLLAAPKKRTTHAKKRMRMAGKYLRTDCSIRQCEVCGAWKRPHTYCTPKCPGRRRSGTPGAAAETAPPQDVAAS